LLYSKAECALLDMCSIQFIHAKLAAHGLDAC